MGWVTLFDPAELAGAAAPARRRRDAGLALPGLAGRAAAGAGSRAGRLVAARRRSADVVLHDRWPAERRPARRSRGCGRRTRHAVVAVRDEADGLLSPPSSLGVLDRARRPVLGARRGRTRARRGDAWCWSAPTTRSPRARRLGLSRVGHARRARRGRRRRGARRGHGGGATGWRDWSSTPGSPAAGRRGASTPGRATPGGDLATATALTSADVERLVAAGRALGAAAAADGLVALGEVGVGNTTVAAALAAALLGRGPTPSSGSAPAPTRRCCERKAAVVDRRAARTRRRPRPAGSCSPRIGGGEIAVLAGVVLGAAAAGAPVVLDGLATSVAALLAVRLEPAVAAHLVAGHRSREAAHPRGAAGSSAWSRCSTCGCGPARVWEPPSRPEWSEMPWLSRPKLRRTGSAVPQCLSRSEAAD